jgi:aspartyl-tRNA(Asn)/glutamyl-tRNA(Gln) amidotransferase subunit A
LNAKETHYSVLSTNTVLAKDYIKSLRIQNMLDEKMNKLFSEVDIIISPVKPKTASQIDENFRWATRKEFNEEHPISLVGAIGNLIGLPAISIPNGFDKNELPTSIHFIANSHQDALVIKIAEYIQATTDWHNKHPN